METNTRHFIERAEHCLRTRQPNLAMLYMKNALDHNDVDRYQIATGQNAEDALEFFTKALQPLSETFRAIGDGFKKLISDFLEAYGKAVQAQREREAKENE